MTGLVIDNFAGGGGASTGIEAALGRPVDIAINHDAQAVAMHAVNHPATRHFCQSIMAIDPLEATQGQPVLLAWFSPDCKHFSKAKGGKPVEKRIRDLAWIVVHWAERLGPNKPQVIMLENVEEFRTWGPLADDGRPCPERKGQTFDEWVRRLRRCGYKVQWKELRACDYGAPTSRKRLFLIARCDGKPIVWPEPTHGPGRPLPWRTAADIIDFSLPCPSIFTRTRPLKDATCRRIATGIMRYVVNAARPFIVPLTHHGSADRVYPVDQPIPTVTGANRGEMALVVPHVSTARPFIVPVTNTNWSADRAWSSDEPLRTITTAKGGEMALVAPTMVQTGYGEREGQAPRALDIEAPLGTVVAGGNKHALVAAFMAQHNGGRIGREAEAPLQTVTMRGTQTNLVTSHLVKLRNNCTGQQLEQPIDTVTTGAHFGEVRAFLVKYYGAADHGQALDDPLHAVTAKARFGLVTCSIDGVEYAIADIGMRMLSPRELFNAQGFPPDYIIASGADGTPFTKTSQIARCGNSVCPPLAEALVRANLPEHCALPAAVAA